MSIFKKLKTGGIIFVVETNLSQKIIHGIPLPSRTLRHRTYTTKQIDDEWNHDKEAIHAAFNLEYYQHKKCTHEFQPVRRCHCITEEKFKERLTIIQNALYAMDHQYRQTG